MYVDKENHEWLATAVSGLKPCDDSEVQLIFLASTWRLVFEKEATP